MNNQPKYKWASPHEWLLWQYDELPSGIMHLLMKLDADEILDEFQDEMECNGYFEPDTDEDESPGEWLEDDDNDVTIEDMADDRESE